MLNVSVCLLGVWFDILMEGGWLWACGWLCAVFWEPAAAPASASALVTDVTDYRRSLFLPFQLHYHQHHHRHQLHRQSAASSASLAPGWACAWTPASASEATSRWWRSLLDLFLLFHLQSRLKTIDINTDNEDDVKKNTRMMLKIVRLGHHAAFVRQYTQSRVRARLAASASFLHIYIYLHSLHMFRCPINRTSHHPNILICSKKNI